MYKIDLHSHSIISHDGGVTAEEYEKALSSTLDCIAITDHNETSFARIMQKKLGEKIIIGEEITTTDGEIIGLFLQKTIVPGLSAEETVQQIRAQNALVYIPHPFETFRKGLKKTVLEKIRHEVDIIEVFNGRGIFRGRPQEADAFANTYQIPKAASSDAHGYQGLGKTYTSITEFPRASSLIAALKTGKCHNHHAPFHTLFYPFINRIKNKILLTNG